MTRKMKGMPVYRPAWLVGLVLFVSAVPAHAQSTAASSRACDDTPSIKGLFTSTLHDFRRVPSSGSLGVLALGGAAAIGARSFDGDLTRAAAGSGSLSSAFTPGAVIGGTPFQLGAALGTYAISRALDKPCGARLGADLFRAQLLAEGLTIGLKEATRRSRPEGAGFSFPSGHTTAAFASATVLQQHFGWKVGLPAYAVASYVAASRVEQRHHYLSDVAFGAALGIVAGRTVTVGHRYRFVLNPIATPDGAGASLTWAGTK